MFHFPLCHIVLYYYQEVLHFCVYLAHYLHKPCVDADSVSPPLVTSSLGDGHSPNVITCVCTRVMSLGSLSTQKEDPDCGNRIFIEYNVRKV